MSILTVSHEIGAGGPEIGQKVADQLGLHYVDQELISDAALRYGVLEEKLSSLDESKPSLFERFDAETRRYITVLQTALYESPRRIAWCSWGGRDSGSRGVLQQELRTGGEPWRDARRRHRE